MQVELGHEPVEFRLAVGELLLGLLEAAQLGGELGRGGAQLGADRAFLVLQRRQNRGSLGQLRLEAGDRLAGLADLGQLIRGLGLHLLDADFEPPGRDRDLGMDLVHVRLDDRHHGRRHGLQAKDGGAAGAHAHGREGAKCEQDGEQKSDPEIDDRFTHYSAPYPGTQPRTQATCDPTPQDSIRSDERSWSSAHCRCRWLEPNDYTRLQTKMTFVCSLAQRFLFGERLRRITAWPQRR